MDEKQLTWVRVPGHAKIRKKIRFFFGKKKRLRRVVVPYIDSETVGELPKTVFKKSESVLEGVLGILPKGI